MVKELTLGLMEESMKGNSRRENIMANKLTRGLMEESMKGYSRLEHILSKEHILVVMEEIGKESRSMGKDMVKLQTFTL